ncbi:hypothetical protein F5Y06DRAFT_293231 [Hypoxylon sp. FL0890]|nr:hypothetical protein F5Y06DRAFT_293231 [Hypoxylon sp. FL0890]
MDWGLQKVLPELALSQGGVVQVSRCRTAHRERRTHLIAREQQPRRGPSKLGVFPGGIHFVMVILTLRGLTYANNIDITQPNLS